MIILCVNHVVVDDYGFYCERKQVRVHDVGWWSLDWINDVGYWLFVVDIDGSSMYNDGCMVKMWWCVQM